MKRAVALLTVFAVAMLAVSAAAADRGRPDAHRRGEGEEGNRPFTYAVIGDTPYGQPQIENFPNDVDEINADPQVRLVLHLGDIKNGSSQCSTEYFEQIRADFDQFADPFVYTPGDNEWTDCHRANNGAYWPAGPVLNGDVRPARLDEIHRIFFDRPGWTLGRHPMRVRTQGVPYAENVLWERSGIVFGDLNVPGSNNDWLPWFEQPRTSSQIDEVTNRTKADLIWLDRIFDRAHEEHQRRDPDRARVHQRDRDERRRAENDRERYVSSAVDDREDQIAEERHRARDGGADHEREERDVDVRSETRDRRQQQWEREHDRPGEKGADRFLTRAGDARERRSDEWRWRERQDRHHRVADDRCQRTEPQVRQRDRREVARPAQRKEREERRPRAGREEVQRERRLHGALKVRRRASRGARARARRPPRAPGTSSRARGS